VYLTAFSDDEAGHDYNRAYPLNASDYHIGAWYDFWRGRHIHGDSRVIRIGLNRHGRGTNGLFFDSHVAFVPKADLKKPETYDDGDYTGRH